MYLGPTPEEMEEMKKLEEEARLKKEAEEKAEKERKEAEEAAERKKRQEEWVTSCLPLTHCLLGNFAFFFVVC